MKNTLLDLLNDWYQFYKKAIEEERKFLESIEKEKKKKEEKENDPDKKIRNDENRE